MNRSEFGSVDFVFTEIGNLLCFQNVSKARLVSKKCILCLGEDFEYKTDRREIVINTIPDAIYNKTTDVLYFKRLESKSCIYARFHSGISPNFQHFKMYKTIDI